MGLGVSYGQSKSSSETTTQMASAVQKIYSLFGESNGKYDLKLPTMRVPGATGTSIDWRKVTRALLQSQADQSE